MLITMYDAAYPPTVPPAGIDAVAGYLGGDTPHIWTPQDWASQPARYRLGIWTNNQPHGAPEGSNDGAIAGAAALAIGFPAGCTIAWDAEEAIDPHYFSAFCSELWKHGEYYGMAYGSASTVAANGRPLWVAHWTGTEHMYPGAIATQYADLPSWDLSIVDTQQVHLWDTQTPQPQPPPESDTMYWTDAVQLPKGQPVILLPPSGVGLGAPTYPSRALHIGYDNVNVATAHTGVRVAFYDPTEGWKVTQTTVFADRDTMTMFFSPTVTKISLVAYDPGASASIQAGNW